MGMLLQGDGGGRGLGRTRREGTDSIRSLKGNSTNWKRDPSGKLSGGLVCFIRMYVSVFMPHRMPLLFWGNGKDN